MESVLIEVQNGTTKIVGHTESVEIVIRNLDKGDKPFTDSEKDMFLSFNYSELEGVVTDVV